MINIKGILIIVIVICLCIAFVFWGTFKSITLDDYDKINELGQALNNLYKVEVVNKTIYFKSVAGRIFISKVLKAIAKNTNFLKRDNNEINVQTFDVQSAKREMQKFVNSFTKSVLNKPFSPSKIIYGMATQGVRIAMTHEHTSRINLHIGFNSKEDRDFMIKEFKTLQESLQEVIH